VSLLAFFFGDFDSSLPGSAPPALTGRLTCVRHIEVARKRQATPTDLGFAIVHRYNGYLSVDHGAQRSAKAGQEPTEIRL
jgi:hypothetical protein